jgi:peptidoglycan-N-acetylglucosamine deacetylase
MLKHRNIVVLCLILLVALFFLKADWWAFLLVFLTWLGLTSWGSFDIRLAYFVKTLCHNQNEKAQRIAITFDDGPHEITEQVLDLLHKHHAKASFFCIGNQIEKHPEVLKRIINEGHTIGNHTFSHSNLFGFFSAKEITEEITKTDALLSLFINKRIKMFRPPFGVTTPNVAKAVANTKHHVIGWNIRSLDTVTEDENEIFERVKKRVKPGGIILLHDTSLKTVNVLERLLLFLQSENYEIITVDQLLNIEPYEN